MRMSLKMENFCMAYALSGVAKSAALAAGYSDSYARCRAYKLLDHLAVRLGIAQLRGEMREHNVGDAEAGESFSFGEPRFRNRYLEVLWAIGSSSMEEMIVDGEMVPPDPGSLAWWAIKSWKQVPDGKGGMTPMIELHDKVPALREFGKATGFNAPVALRPTGKGSGPSFDDEPTDEDRPFVGGSDRGFAVVAAGQSGDWRAREATDEDRAFVGGSDRGSAALAAGQSGDWRAREATDEDRAFVGGSDRGSAAELLHAVPRELAMWLVTRLEEASEVNVIPE